MGETLAQLDGLKLELGFAGNEHDALLRQYLEQATAEAERVVGRGLIRREDIVAFPHLQQPSRRLRLARPPLESVESVKVASRALSGEQFDELDDLVEGEHYIIHAEPGVLERIHHNWPAGHRRIRVVYTGGFVADADAADHPDAYRIPADLRRGLIAQCVQWWEARGKGPGHPGQGPQAQPRAETHADLMRACMALRRLM